MKAPRITTTLRDTARNIDYHVVAYRELTKPELLSTVRIFIASNPRTKPKPGESIRIVTTIGAGDG